MEVVSRETERRDTVEKRRDYAEGRIPEYWIVNPLNEKIMAYVLEAKRYRRVGTFGREKSVASVHLEGFEVNVDEVFDAK